MAFSCCRLNTRPTLILKKMETNTNNSSNLAECGNKSKPLLCDVFSVGDTVNYCNGLIFKIAKINKEAETCYDEKGMWYALVNCVNIT